MNIIEKSNNLIINIQKNDLNLADTLDCGQCFRFKALENNDIYGIAMGRELIINQTDSQITFYDMTADEFNQIWKNYFDLPTDYNQIRTILSNDETLKKAITYAGGIRILRQDSFEALFSFIISQNNNIPRIKGSIERLCNKFGKAIANEKYAFPTLNDLKGAKKIDFADLGLGYRDDYLADCVEKLENEEIDLVGISTMPIDEARATLRKIKGIGPKVAECALLFGFYHVDAFPIDTWVKKVLKEFYPNGFPEEYKQIAGIAQQYLFHYMRTGI